MAVLNFFWCSLAACAVFIVNPGMGADNLFSLIFGANRLEERYFTTESPIDEIAAQIRFKIYTSVSIEDVPILDSELIYALVDHTKPVVLYAHGYREHPSNESIRTVVGAHLERGTDNIILLDWSDLAFESYLTVAVRIKHIATILAQTFDDLVELGLNLETFHFVGHSLGAQIGGLFGKYSRHSIPRITGLDPAKPGFYHPGAEHIDASSARFVDVVHTDGGFYGALSATGTADFYANGGTRPQPGCPLLGIPLTPSGLCSHWRSWRFYAESVVNEFAFPAVQCPSYRDFISGKCTWNPAVFFGYSTPTNAHGSFYFTTNNKSPFSNNTNLEPTTIRTNLLE